MTELIDDPNQIAKLAEVFTSSSDTVDIKTYLPEDTLVKLPAGYLFDDGTVATDAEVRELNGADEEAIAKASSVSASINVALKRGLVSIGGVPASQLNLDNLLLGDRDAILLSIRVATFGSDIDYTDFCPVCESSTPHLIDLKSGVDTVYLEDPANDRVFDVEIKPGTAALTLPTLVTNKRLEAALDKSSAEFTTELISGCLVGINGEPVVGKSVALNLGMKDRKTLVDELSKRYPGPRLSEVRSACEACGTEIKVALALADLFRI